VIEPNSVSERITANIDVTATIADAAGVMWPMEGKSALSSPRTGIVLEAVRNGKRPAYCGWRSEHYLYVRYSAGAGRELYDYRADPAELENVAGKARYSGIEARLERKTERNCQPFPPEFSWN
jgi:arylsulfatase A-like enzyme